MSLSTIRRLLVVCLATLGVAGCELLLSGSPAFGEETFVFHESFGSAGAGNGEFTDPTGIAVNNSTGETYVLDKGDNRVERFGANHEYLGQFDGETAPAGAFASPNAIAVDSDPASPSFGDVYVSDPGHDVVDKFTATGVYVSQLGGTAMGRFEEEPVGVAVDRSGDLWVYESEGYLDEFDDAESNSFLGQTEPGSEATPGIAVDSKDDVYFVQGYFHNTWKFVPAEDESVFFLGFEGCGCVTGVAVDPVTNNVYDDQGSSVVEYGPFGEPFEKPVVQFGAGDLSGGSGMAVVNGNARSVYVVDSTLDKVDVFAFATLPDVSTGAVSNLGGASATVAGVTNPDGIAVSSCRFEYGTGAEYGSSMECSSAVGSGSEEVPVSAELAGLLPGTLYHYRLAVGNASGVDQGADATFRTPASVLDLPASNVMALGATLNATVDPGPVPTSYHFVYGTSTGYGQVVPVPDLYAPEGYVEDAASQAITGLQPDTTYHYALVANSPGGTATGADEEFTTPAVAAPGVGTGGASEVTRGSAALAGSIDSQGWDTTYEFQYGTSTGYGQSWPSVPVQLGGLEGAQGVIATVENLQPGTVYHYRLVASNAGGTSYGADQTFTTGSYPPSAIAVAPVGAPIGIAPAKSSPGKHKAKRKRKGKVKRRAKRTRKKG